MHAFLFSGPFSGSVQTAEVRRLLFLTGAIAILDLDVRLTGTAAPPPPPLTEETAFRNRLVLEKRQGTWQIVAHQLTVVQ